MTWNQNHTVTIRLDPALMTWLNRLLDLMGGGMTATEAAAVTARLNADAARLDAVAAEPKSPQP